MPSTTAGPAARPAATSSGCTPAGAGRGTAAVRSLSAAPPLTSGRRDHSRGHRVAGRRRRLRRPGSGQDHRVAGSQGLGAVPADHLVGDLSAAAPMLEAHRWTRRGHVAVAPASQRDDHRPEVVPRLGEAVLVTLRPLLIADAVEDPGGAETLEA